MKVTNNFLPAQCTRSAKACSVFKLCKGFKKKETDNHQHFEKGNF